jgi:hypothetical protein
MLHDLLRIKRIEETAIPIQQCFGERCAWTQALQSGKFAEWLTDFFKISPQFIA